MSALDDFMQAASRSAPPILPPVPGTPAGPAGVPGTPGIAPGGPFAPISPDERKSVWDDFYARLPKPSDFWAGLGIIGGSVGVYLILLVLFGLGVWGLLEGSGGAVGYVAAPRPFARPRK